MCYIGILYQLYDLKMRIFTIDYTFRQKLTSQFEPGSETVNLIQISAFLSLTKTRFVDLKWYFPLKYKSFRAIISTFMSDKADFEPKS